MNVIKRKNTSPIKLGRSSNGERKFRFMFQIKLVLVLLCAGLGYFVYSNWQSWLESLDGDRKITAYALVGQNEFTTYPDVQDVLLKMGELKGFWAQDVKQIREQLETIPWVKGAVVRKVWPNRLSIWLSEYQPVAIWNKTEFVTKDGIVFQLPMDKLKEKPSRI